MIGVFTIEVRCLDDYQFYNFRNRKNKRIIDLPNYLIPEFPNSGIVLLTNSIIRNLAKMEKLRKSRFRFF